MTVTVETAAAHVATPRAAAKDRGSRSFAAAWVPVVAWGAGLLEIAIAAGMPADVAVWPLRGALLACGAAGLVWGAVTLVRGRLVAARSAVLIALLGLVATACALAIDARTSVLAVAAAGALLMAVALACARQQRVQTDAAPPRLLVLMIAAVVVAGVATPALGATEAGLLAPDHGSHGIVDPGHH